MRGFRGGVGAVMSHVAAAVMSLGVNHIMSANRPAPAPPQRRAMRMEPRYEPPRYTSVLAQHGERECARRRRQIVLGRLRVENGLAKGESRHE